MRRLFNIPLLILGLSLYGASGSAKTLEFEPQTALPQPSPERAYLVTVSRALETGDLDRAERLLRTRLDEVSDDAIAWEALGVTLALKGETEAADDAYGQAVELDPNRLSAWVKRGDLAEAAGDALLAQTYWRGALDVAPSYRPALERLGRAYAEAGDSEKAIPLLETAVAGEEPDEIGLKPDLALSYNRTGRAADTLTLMAPWDAAEAEPVAVALLALGNAHAALGDPAAALNRYERGLAADSENTGIARAMGALLVETGQMERAADVLAAPASAEPVDAFANLAYARALASLGQYADAITAADRAVTAADGPGLERQAVSVLARAHLLDQDPAAAVAASARLIDVYPDDVAAWREHSTIVAATGQYEQALALYDDALARFAGDPQLLRGRSLTHIRLSNLDAAAKDAAQAVEAAPNWIEPRFLMGEIARARNLNSDAKAAYLGVLEIDPDHAPSLLNLARLAQEEGALTEAEEYAERAVAVSDGAEAAQTTLTEIKRQLSNP